MFFQLYARSEQEAHARNHGGRIVSWKDAGDPSPGSFSYGIDPDTSLQLLMWNGSKPYWRTTVWTGYMTAGRYLTAAGNMYLDVVDTDEEIYMAFRVSDGASPMRYVITNSGEYQFLSWNRSSLEWNTIYSWPSLECSKYGYCGPYGYCDFTAEPVPTCKCLDSFEPAIGDEWNSGRSFSRGCRRKEALPCGGGDFLSLPLMKVPDKFVLKTNLTSDECAAECTRNCSCQAYAHAKLSSSSAKGDIGRCLLWLGELIDTQMLGHTRWSRAGETLYLRVPAGFTKKQGQTL
ncbi:hypothetical protein ABZP36_033971 [Zizania latifolia]